MSKNKKYTLDLVIEMQVEVSEDYLERMDILPIEWPFGVEHASEAFRREYPNRVAQTSEILPQHPLFRSVLNQCFKNNRRTLDKLFIDSIEVREEQS